MDPNISQSPSSPLAQLATLDWYGPDDEHHDYAALGITTDHADELWAAVFNETFHFDDASDEEIRLWTHAMWALARMNGPGTIERLLPAFARFQHENEACDLVVDAFAMLGPPAVPALRDFLIGSTADEDHMARLSAMDALDTITGDAPEHRAEWVDALCAVLRDGQDTIINGAAVATLCDLKAVEALPTIRAAFAADMVEISMAGDLEDVEIDLGVRTERDTPRPVYNAFTPEDHEGLAPLDETDDGAEVHAPDLAWIDDDALPSAEVEPYVRTDPKVGRNDPCPCGSGKKYKKCCGG